MEKEIGKIKKNETTDIIIRLDDYKGKRGLTIREYITGERYTGFTKAGVRISAEDFFRFRELINNIDYNEFMGEVNEEKNGESKESGEESKETATSKEVPVVKKERKPRKKKAEEEMEEVKEEEIKEEEIKEEIEEMKPQEIII